MKKKFILLPITLTALSPMVGLVSCNEPKPEPTPTDEIIVDDFKYDTTLQCLKTTINLEANQKYCFVIKVKDYSLTDLNVWFKLEFNTYVNFGGVSVEIDGVFLNCYGSSTPDFDIENGYYYPFGMGHEGEFLVLHWKYSQTNQNSIIKIHFISNQRINNILIGSKPESYWG